MRRILGLLIITTLLLSSMAIMGAPAKSSQILMKGSSICKEARKIRSESRLVLGTNQLPYTIKILFDEAHDQYFNSERLSDFLADIKKEFGVIIEISTEDTFDVIPLEEYSLILFMDPNVNVTKDEVAALQSYLENYNGTIFVGGTWYRYFEPWTVNFTVKYGIDWYDASVRDNTTNAGAVYYPIVHNWANTNVAAFVSNNSEFEVEFSGTALKLVGSNDTVKTIYLVGLGDEDTYLYLEDGTTLETFQDTIFFAAVDLITGGRFFAAGSAQIFRNDFYASYDNKPFGLRVIHWLLAEGLEIVSLDAPSELYVGEEGYVYFTVRNNEEVTARNVHVGIETAPGVGLKNATNDVLIGNLAPGEEKTFVWHINGTDETSSNITVKVWCDNLPGFSKAAQIEVKLPSIEVEAKASPWKLYLGETTEFTLEVKAKAPRIFDADDIWVNITLPEGLTTTNDTETHIDHMDAGTSVVLKYYISVSERGAYEITITTSGTYALGNLKIFTTKVMVYAYDTMIVLDQGHDQYYGVSRLYGLLDLLVDWGYVYINNETLTQDIISKAHLIIIPNPETPLSPTEIDLLKSYVENGGAILIMGTFYAYLNASNLNLLTSEYGITWEEGLLIDEENNVEDNVRIPKLTEFGEDVLAQILTQELDYVAFSYSTYLNVSDLAIPVIYGNPTTYVNTTEGKTNITGRMIVAAAAYENQNGGKIIALGGSGTLAYELDPQNAKFAENILNWVLGPTLLGDTEKPTIEIQPLPKEYFNVRDVTISWNATDNVGVSFFIIYCDGALVGTVGAATNEYTIRDLDDGTHIVRIYAVDKASLYNYDEISFVVDTVSPTITPVSPQSGDTVYQGNITLEFDLSDETGVAYVEIYIDGVLNKTIENPGTHVVTWIIIEELGDHTITIVAYDLAGNSNSVIIDITVVKRPTPGPTISPMLIVAVIIVVVIGILGYVAYARRK